MEIHQGPGAEKPCFVEKILGPWSKSTNNISYVDLPFSVSWLAFRPRCVLAVRNGLWNDRASVGPDWMSSPKVVPNIPWSWWMSSNCPKMPSAKLDHGVIPYICKTTIYRSRGEQEWARSKVSNKRFCTISPIEVEGIKSPQILAGYTLPAKFHGKPCVEGPIESWRSRHIQLNQPIGLQAKTTWWCII